MAKVASKELKDRQGYRDLKDYQDKRETRCELFERIFISDTFSKKFDKFVPFWIFY